MSCHGIRPQERAHLPHGSQSAKNFSGPGVYHEVKAGQTLWSIARAYNAEVRTLARTNQITDTTNVYVGQRLFIPGATQVREADSRCPCGPEATPPPPTASKSMLLFARPSQRSDTSRVSSAPSSLAPAPTLEHVSFIWPIQGQVSRGFEQDATRRHDGIDLSAPQGTSIRAAAHGEVMFSGWGPGGYGRTVILQHQADLVTIYAHNQENLVQVGQRVRQGETIATVGQSGRATGNHLHFEVRHKAVPISPYKFLPPRPSNVAELTH
ncbi:MAG: peptidoglycan DD-metalloendopeptidase family protein [Candidatus Tectimicrobiota bacterium]